MNYNSLINTTNELENQILDISTKAQAWQLSILEKIGSAIKILRIELRKVRSINGSCLNLRKVRSESNFENSWRIMNYRLAFLNMKLMKSL